MRSKVKVTVSLDKIFVDELAGLSRKTRKSRSRLVEEALAHWKRSRLEQEMKEGYLALAKENRESAERNMQATWEVVK